MDVRPHPHIGLATVTYLFDGEIMHRDSLASQQAICPGEVNWMTAGSGITHSERFERARLEGGRLHGIQAWVALPAGQEEIAPAFHHHGAADLPTYEGDGLWARLIAGEAFGARAKVRTHSPMFYAHWRLGAGAKAQLPAEYAERAAYIAAGSVEVDNQRFGPGKMLVFAPGTPVLFTAIETATVMLLGGEPIGPRIVEWNFVSSSQERIDQAKADWRAGRMKLPDLTTRNLCRCRLTRRAQRRCASRGSGAGPKRSAGELEFRDYQVRSPGRARHAGVWPIHRSHAPHRRRW